MPKVESKQLKSEPAVDKFVAPDEWKSRCEIIRLSHKNKGDYLPLHIDFMRALLEVDELYFIVFFAVGWDLFEFMRPADFSHDLVKEMIKTHKEHPKETRIVILRKDLHHFQKIVKQYRRSKFEKSTSGASMVFEPTFKVYEALSDASQLVMKGSIGVELYTAVAAGASFAVMNLPSTKDVIGFAQNVVAKEPLLYDHGALSSLIAAAIAWNSLKLKKRESKVCAQSALMHDVERNCSYLMKPAIPAQISESSVKDVYTLREEGTSFHDHVAMTMRQYREKFAGGGYPNERSGRFEDQGDLGIIQTARIVAIACAISEYTLKRKDKNPLTWDEVVHFMTARMHTEFDPVIWNCFCEDLASGSIRKATAKLEQGIEDAGESSGQKAVGHDDDDDDVDYDAI